MNRIEIEVRRTDELSASQIEAINELKNQHWRHTKEEHMRWFKENIEPNDAHLLMWEGECLLAYLNLVHVDVEIDKRPYRMLGIGNVCVSKDKEHTGFGAILMMAANAFLKETKSCGLLLCHENTLKFYENCGWKKLVAGTSLVKGNPYEHHVLFFDPNHALSDKTDQFVANRSF